MYDSLDRALNKTKRRLSDVCEEMNIKVSDVDYDELLNAQCVNCGIWGNKFTELVYEDYDVYVCEFCDNLDTLRF
jgi:hypothetical protein